jgi:hypothetical protein
MFQGNLYLGGFFTMTADTSVSLNSIAMWDGVRMSALPSGSSNGVLGGFVRALAVFDSKLYVGGDFLTLGDGTTFAKNSMSGDGSRLG